MFLSLKDSREEMSEERWKRGCLLLGSSKRTPCLLIYPTLSPTKHKHLGSVHTMLFRRTSVSEETGVTSITESVIKGREEGEGGWCI